MAHIILNRKHLVHNYQYLSRLFKGHDIEWGIVSKVLCGSTIYLKEIIATGAFGLFYREVAAEFLTELASARSLLNAVEMTGAVKEADFSNVPDLPRRRL